MKAIPLVLSLAKIKFILLAFFIVFVANFLFSNTVLTAPQIDGMTKNIATQSGYGPATATSLSETAGTIIRVVLSLVGVIFLILTIYAGFLWMTAAGEEEKVTKATKILTYATIGLIIIIAAYSITWFVVGAITGAAKPATVGGVQQEDPCQGFFAQLGNTSCW